jgi:hypothetical protein
VILIRVSLPKEMSVGSVSVQYTKCTYQFAKFTVALQSVLWSPIPQLSYLDVNAAVSLNYMDVLMTHIFICCASQTYDFHGDVSVLSPILFVYLFIIIIFFGGGVGVVCMLFYCLELN